MSEQNVDAAHRIVSEIEALKKAPGYGLLVGLLAARTRKAEEELLTNLRLSGEEMRLQQVLIGERREVAALIETELEAANEVIRRAGTMTRKYPGSTV